MSATLVVVRHGQSTWNQKNLFTGWVDVDLTDLGREEAQRAGQLLKDSRIEFDAAHTSLLTRAVKTANLALETLGQCWLPVSRTFRLNERHYGALQGKDKKQMVQQFGAEQVQAWRRSFDVPPPPLDGVDPAASDVRYRRLAPDVLPKTECLKDVVARVLPYWHDSIVPQLKANHNVLVVAHGNSLRALVMHLEKMSPDAIVELNIPTGMPRVYEFDQQRNLSAQPRYLDEAAARAAADSVAKQTG
jgi:2,3-bisphosphoglycerate-dependent phosphoglycerate mutase